MIHMKNVNMIDESFLGTPEELSLPKLPVPIPPNIDEAFGYLGSMRFVAVYRTFTNNFPSETLLCDDSEDTYPVDPVCWNLFCAHPAVAPILRALKIDLQTQPRKNRLELVTLLAKNDSEFF